jgi:type II secretory pathway pseudopilin PulG
MKLVPRQIPVARAAAFTMVEIAISLAIIGFSLVAIIGVLPLGLNVQRENREETIINQDAATFMEAIRSGARGLDDLTNAVFAITNYWRFYPIVQNKTNTPVPSPPNPPTAEWYTYTGSHLYFPLTNGFVIIGVLTTPKYVFTSEGFYSNHVVAYVRALSGLAAEKFPQNNPDVRQDAFSYRMIVENMQPPLPPDYATNAYGRALANNLHEVRLSFAWPLLPNGTVGYGRQTFRSMVAGTLTNYYTSMIGLPRGVGFFYQPQSFSTNTAE